MRLRTALAMIAMISGLGSTRAAAPTPAGKDAGPAGVMQTAPVGKILTDIRAAAQMVGGEMAVKAFEDGLKTALGEKGFSGLDLSKPLAGYVIYDAKDVKKTSFILTATITKSEDFLDLLKRSQLEPDAVPNTKNLYKLSSIGIPNVQGGDEKAEVLLRIEDKRAIVGFNVSADALDPAKVYPEETLVDPKETALIAYKQFHDRLPPEVAKNASKQYEEAVAEMKKNFGGTQETAVMEVIGRLMKSAFALTEHSKESGARLVLNVETGELIIDSYFTPRPGTELAKDVAARKPGENQFAAAIDTTTVGAVLVQLPVGMKDVQELIGLGFEKIEEKLKDEPPPAEFKDLVDELLKGLKRTVKNGTLDFANVLNGPDKDGHYVAYNALSFEDSKPLEKAIKAAAKDFPAELRDGLKFDVDKIGELSIHSFEPPDRGEPEGYTKLFGDRKVYIVFGPKAIHFAVGNGAKETLKKQLSAKPANARAFDVLVNPRKVVQVAQVIEPMAAGPVEQVVGNENKLLSVISFSLESGESLRFRFSMNLKAIPRWIAMGMAMDQ